MASAAKTTNLALPQWTADEKPERADFNAALLALDGAVIVASGSNAYGDYVKFATGMMICTFEMTPAAGSTNDDGAFLSPAFGWTFPVPFYSKPKTSESIVYSVATGAYPLGVTRIAGSDYTTAAKGNLYVCYHKAHATVQARVSLIAIGPWKA